MIADPSPPPPKNNRHPLVESGAQVTHARTRAAPKTGALRAAI